MNAIKIFAFITALFAAQSAMATTYDYTYDFGNMGPPGDKGVSVVTDPNKFEFYDLFTFTINAPANAVGVTTSSAAFSAGIQLSGVNVTDITLFNSNATPLNQFIQGLSNLDTTPSAFSFNNLSTGSYSIVVGGNTLPGFNAYSIVLDTVTTPVPEPKTYAMMLAGLALVVFAARRKQKVAI